MAFQVYEYESWSDTTTRYPWQPARIETAEMDQPVSNCDLEQLTYYRKNRVYVFLHHCYIVSILASVSSTCVRTEERWTKLLHINPFITYLPWYALKCLYVCCTKQHMGSIAIISSKSAVTRLCFHIPCALYSYIWICSSICMITFMLHCRWGICPQSFSFQHGYWQQELHFQYL